MEKIVKKNELGIIQECYVVASTVYNDENYIIYTNLTNNEDGDLNLFTAKVANNVIVNASSDISKIILDEFKIMKKNFINSLEMNL